MMAAARINCLRGYAQWTLRALATACVVFGLYLVIKRLLFAAGTRQVSIIMATWGDDMGDSNSLYRGLALILIGVILASTAGRVSRWIVTVPPLGCPRCGHERAPGHQAGRCSECGLELS